MTVVVIPAYQPDEQLIMLATEIKESGLSALIVNDGSGREKDAIFKEVEKLFPVIHQRKNEGKGAALKEGFASLKSYYPDCTHFITADADGQHKVADIVRVHERLLEGNDFVLTVRKREGKIPFRSKFGNDLSRIVYTVMNGHYFDDNQSGLRGFSIGQLDWLLQVKGNKYDYEMNMLCFADKQNVKIETLPIKAIYIDGNRSSHFNPIADTLRIYRRLFGTTWPSLLGVLLWAMMTMGFSIFLDYRSHTMTVPSAVMLPAILTAFLYKFLVLRNLKYRDAIRMLLFSIIRASIYTVTVNTVAAFTTAIPLSVVVFAIAFIFFILEYFIHKKMHKIL